VVFIPNFNISIAEVLAAGCDLSQHISAAGSEASGVSNIYFAMNAGLILGTLDGLNVELREEIGESNMFIFGANASQVDLFRKNYATPVSLGEDLPSEETTVTTVPLVRPKTKPTSSTVLSISRRLEDALNLVKSGKFGDYNLYSALIEPVAKGNDHYLIAKDFDSYYDVQKRVDAAFKDKGQWVKKSITTALSMGKFSIDSTIRSYVSGVWDLEVSPMPEDDWVGKYK